MPTATLLRRLTERPLHAAAYSGAVEVPGACLLVSDGIIHAAFDPGSDRLGDAVMDSLPSEVDATLHALPAGGDPRTLALLASALLPPATTTSGLDASYVDIPQLADKLSAEGFHGLLRIHRGPLAGLVFFGRGRRVLDLFSIGWPAAPAMPRWEDWIGGSGAEVSIEPARTAFPSVTYRQQLQDVELAVTRPPPAAPDSMRSDTLADAHALRLTPRDSAAAELRRGESTVRALLDGAPAVDAARWVLGELPPLFEQFQRTGGWKRLLSPLSRVGSVRLYHALPTAEGGVVRFDAVLFSADGRPTHVIDRAGVGDRKTVADFLARAVAARRSPEGAAMGGAILFAPKFPDDALAAYVEGLAGSEKGSLFSGLDALAHREGFLRLGIKGGFHALLVEDADGRRRPMMPA